MADTIKLLFSRILNHEALTREETCKILMGITRGDYATEQIGALLTAMQMRGVSVDELLGFRDGILSTGVAVKLDCDRFIDIVGTGGDGKNTFNISTAACFVVAGTGYKVAKHGNYSATSTSGASNVIEQHGVKFTADNDTLQRSIDECGIVYLHAPLFAKAMKYVAPTRKALPFPTCFNLLGPLVNPSTPPCQVLGVASLKQMRLYSAVYQNIGIDYAIVNSIDGYDEISLTGEFKIMTKYNEEILTPEDLGLKTISPSDLTAGQNVEEAARVFDEVLAGTAPESKKEVVVANAAIAINVLDKGKKSFDDCIAIARESLDSGNALATFKKFVSLNS